MKILPVLMFAKFQKCKVSIKMWKNYSIIPTNASTFLATLLPRTEFET